MTIAWDKKSIEDLTPKVTGKDGTTEKGVIGKAEDSIAGFNKKVFSKGKKTIGGIKKGFNMAEAKLAKFKAEAEKINRTLTDLTNDLAGTGFVTLKTESVTGGNEAFYNKLVSYIDNSADPLRPNFSTDAYVGCVLVLVCAPSLAAVNGLMSKVDALMQSSV